MAIVLGLIVAIPAAIAGYIWATWYSRRFEIVPDTSVSYEELLAKFTKLPSATASFAPPDCSNCAYSAEVGGKFPRGSVRQRRLQASR